MTPPPKDRRRTERRSNVVLSELTLPEFRRIVATSTLFVIVLVLFLWMVRTVIIAGILGVVIAAYLKPLYAGLRERLRDRKVPAAVLTLAVTIVPVLGVVAYSYAEILDVAAYLVEEQIEIAAEIYGAVRHLPFLEGEDSIDLIWWIVGRASMLAAQIPAEVGEDIPGMSVSAAIFLFTAFYLLTQGSAVAGYIRSKIASRYAELTGALEVNVRGVLYGAIYSTLLTQTFKSVVILALNLAFGVPLAFVLAVVSFVIGFFPIVGSWSVYAPVAVWLLIFRDAPVQAGLMVLIGFFVNTIFFSMYLRPKIAADKSRVLNFYWMFVGLVAGVYTFGIAGILLGPILIGVLKAIVDTITNTSSWRLIEREMEGEG